MLGLFLISTAVSLLGSPSAYKLRRVEDAALLDSSTQLAAELALNGQNLQRCTQAEDRQATGWTGSGSCNWDAADTGYHEVCVTITEEFLQSSASNDGNDLSSVVQPGGHWCICAWAFASAVQRDANNMQGLQLDCSRTNAKLRDVYQHFIDEGEPLTSPSGIDYEASAALDYVNNNCL
jgi:uncharacterized protein (DUF2237 family)